MADSDAKAALYAELPALVAAALTDRRPLLHHCQSHAYSPLFFPDLQLIQSSERRYDVAPANPTLTLVFNIEA